MTRVALLTYDDTPPEGGQGVYVRDLRSGLESRGVEVVTLSGRGDHAIPFRSVLHRAPLDFSLHVNRHPEVIAGAAADVVHLQGGPGGVLLTRRIEAPLVVTAHHTYRQAYGLTSPRRALSRLEARCYRQARQILAVSASTAAAVAAMGIAHSRIEVLAPGIHLPPAGDAQRVPGRILFVGRLEAEKGVLDAVRIMAGLAAEGHPVSGHIVGRGSLRTEVEAECARSTGVTFIGGVDDARLATEYAEAEIVLVPSRYEGLGLVALEAMAAGAVVVGYDVVGLRDAALGVAPLVAAGDLVAMSAVAAALLADPRRRADLAARGRAEVAARHSWERHIDRVIEVYGAVCP